MAKVLKRLVTFFISLQVASSLSVSDQSSNSLISDDKSARIIGKHPESAQIAQVPFIVTNNTSIGVCICVTIGSCALAGGSPSTTPTDGSGSLDVRIVNVSQ